MKTTSVLLLVSVAIFAAVVGGLYGMYQVTHGHPLPVAHATSLITMPAIAAVLAALAIPVFRYRKQLLEIAKSGATAGEKPALPRPKRLDPFYAVRVLVLAKSTAVASSVVGGFQIGLVVLQLSTPVVSSSVWLNVTGVIGSVLALIVALIVERACKIPDGGIDGGTDGVAA